MRGDKTGVRVNGIELGEGSPLLGHRGVRTFTPSEADVQKGLLELLVGKALPGQPRTIGGGMSEKYPELVLVYAINPNKGGNNSKAARGMAKAMGNLAGMPDLCLPVCRGPFHSLYLEVKTLTGRVDKTQNVLHDLLREQGHCVMVGRGIENCAQIVLGYLALPHEVGWNGLDRAGLSGQRFVSSRLGSVNRVSARPVPRDITLKTIDERIVEWRRQCEEMLKPGER